MAARPAMLWHAMASSASELTICFCWTRCCYGALATEHAARLPLHLLRPTVQIPQNLLEAELLVVAIKGNLPGAGLPCCRKHTLYNALVPTDHHRNAALADGSCGLGSAHQQPRKVRAATGDVHAWGSCLQKISCAALPGTTLPRQEHFFLHN